MKFVFTGDLCFDHEFSTVHQLEYLIKSYIVFDAVLTNHEVAQLHLPQALYGATITFFVQYQPFVIIQSIIYASSLRTLSTVFAKCQMNSCATIYEINRIQPCRNMPIMNQWYKSIYATIGVLATYMYLFDAKFQVFNSNLMLYSWLFLFLLLCLLPACYVCGFKTLNIQYPKSRINIHDKTRYNVEWRNNGDKYKVAPSSIRASVDIPSEITKSIYAFHSIKWTKAKDCPKRRR